MNVQNAERLVDLLQSLAGVDERWLTYADSDSLRLAAREWRDQARIVLEVVVEDMRVELQGFRGI